MSEARKTRRRVPGWVASMLVCGAVLGGLFFGLIAVAVGQPAVFRSVFLGAVLGAVAVLVGVAGTPERESLWGKGLFMSLAAGFVFGFEAGVFSQTVWPDGGFLSGVVVSAVGIPFSFCLGVAYSVTRHTLTDVTN